MYKCQFVSCPSKNHPTFYHYQETRTGKYLKIDSTGKIIATCHPCDAALCSLPYFNESLNEQSDI